MPALSVAVAQYVQEAAGVHMPITHYNRPSGWYLFPDEPVYYPRPLAPITLAAIPPRNPRNYAA